MHWLGVVVLLIGIGAGQIDNLSVSAAVPLTDPQDLAAQGRIYIEQGRLAAAESEFLKAIEAWRAASPSQPFNLALTHGSLADVYRRKQDVERASAQYEIADSLLAALAERIQDQRRSVILRQRGRLLSDHGLTFLTARQYHRAEQLFRRSIAVKEEALPGGHLDFAVTYANLGEALIELGRDDEAAELFRRSIQTREPILRPDHEEIGRSYGFLAGIAVRAERPEKAIDYFKRAVRALHHNPDFWHPTLAVYLSDLTELLSQAGQYAEAERWARQEVAVRQQYPAEDSADLAYAMLRQGQLILAQGKAAAAIPLLEKALALGGPHALPEDFDPAEYLYSLAAAHEQLQQYDESIVYVLKAIALAEQLFGPDDARLIPYLEGYSGLLGRAGQYEDLPAVLRRIVELTEAVKGLNHPDLIDPLLGLQNATAYLGQYEKSIAAMKRALQIADEQGADNETLAGLLNNLGLLYVKLGQIGQAEPFLQDAMALFREEYGADSLRYASSLANLAAVYEAHQQYDEAISLGEAALAIREAHPEDPESIALSLNNLATAYRLSGHTTDPEPMYLRAIALISEAVGPEHPTIASPMNNLAGHYRNNGRFEEAEQLYMDVLRIREAAFGKAHEKYANALNNLGVLYLETERKEQAEQAFRDAITAYREADALANLEAVRPLSNLSSILIDDDRLAEALPFVDTTAQVQALNLGTDSWDYRQSQSTMAWIYAAYGHYEEALDLYRSLLAFLMRTEGLAADNTKAVMAQMLQWEAAKDHPP